MPTQEQIDYVADSVRRFVHVAHLLGFATVSGTWGAPFTAAQIRANLSGDATRAASVAASALRRKGTVLVDLDNGGTVRVEARQEGSGRYKRYLRLRMTAVGVPCPVEPATQTAPADPLDPNGPHFDLLAPVARAFVAANDAENRAGQRCDVLDALSRNVDVLADNLDRVRAQIDSIRQAEDAEIRKAAVLCRAAGEALDAVYSLREASNGFEDLRGLTPQIDEAIAALVPHVAES